MSGKQRDKSTKQMDITSYVDKSRSHLGMEKEVSLRDLVDIPSTTYGTFGLYRYPAKFIPHVVAYILEQYAKPNMTVFDPFAGYGTVGPVSSLYGHDYELWDLNPILHTLHKVTTLEPKTVDVSLLVDNVMKSTEEFLPDWRNFNYWFAEELLPILSGVWGYFHKLDDKYIKTLLAIPLLKTSRHFSYDDMGRMKLSKSPKSTERIENLLQGDWTGTFRDMLGNQIKRIIRGLKEFKSLSPVGAKARIRSGIDSLTENLEEDKDILITSPPYLQSQEYMRQAKMDLFWLGYKEQEIRDLSKLEIPYRDVETFPIQSDTFESIRNEISEDRIRRVYDRYFWAVTSALDRLSENIKSYLFVFVGRSSMRGRQVPIDSILAEHFSGKGWEHVETLVDTIVAKSMFSYRINPATGKKDNRTSTEHLVVLRKP